MEKRKIGIIAIVVFMVICALVGIGFMIYVYATYGNTPIKDLPAWALPFFTN